MQAQSLWSMGLAAHCMWHPPGPGIEPMSPALAGGFLPTVPPGRFQHHIILILPTQFLLCELYFVAPMLMLSFCQQPGEVKS